MADFQSQAMGLTGLTIDGSSTAPSRTEFSQFLNDGVIDVTSKVIKLRPQEMDSFTRESSEQTSNGFNPGTRSVVSVIRESGTNNQWYPCTKKPIGLQYRVTDPESLHFASKYSPVYMITQNRNVHVYPEPSADGDDTFKVLYVNYSPEESDGTALDHASTGIKWFPDDKVYLVVLYASIQSLMARLTSLNSSLPSDITLPSLPVTPSMNTTTVSIPSFTAPDAFVQPAVPAGADIDFSGVPSAPTFASPAVPLLTDNSLQNWPETSPVYTPPIPHTPDWGDSDNWISTEEDNEMATVRIQESQAKISEYNTSIQSAVQEFNDANVEYQADMQKSIQNAQLDQTDDNQLIQKYSSEVQGEVARVNKDMQEYQQEIGKAIQKYQAETGYDLKKYTSEVQSSTAKFTSDLQKNNTSFQGDLAKFSVDLKETQQENQEKLALYNTDVQKYSANVAGKAQEFTTSLQKDQADYQWASQQYTSLKAQYNEVFSMMRPPAPPQQPQQRVAQRRR